MIKEWYIQNDTLKEGKGPFTTKEEAIATIPDDGDNDWYVGFMMVAKEALPCIMQTVGTNAS